MIRRGHRIIRRSKSFKSIGARITRPGRKRSKRGIGHKSKINALDAIFSRYIRAKYSKNGLVACFTCQKRAPIAKMQNGHYVSRGVRAVRWDENNCRPQCVGCNIFKHGDPITFRENLVKEVGEDEVRRIENARKTIFKPSREFLEQKIIHYTEELKRLEEKSVLS